ncbi:MAG: hypothetical protein ACFCUQ_16595 [Kiloniellales bacterium]
MASLDSERLGSYLVASGLAKLDDIVRALERQKREGGRLGDNLVALGIVSEERLEAMIHAKPTAPRSVQETGISEGFLLQLLVKAVHSSNLETPSQMKDMLRLPYAVITRLLEEATDRKLILSAGAGEGVAFAETRYTLSADGRNWARELLSQCHYVGPAPVSLHAYQNRIKRQRITNERIDQKMIDEAFSDLVVTRQFIESIGPGINSGRCILLYGPPGNGKTSVAAKIGSIFRDIIYIPYCVEVDGQIINVFDPAIHKSVEPQRDETKGDKPKASLVEDDFDHRWVACRRPIVIVGGELTLAMLDLEFNSYAKFYEAPLHVKALGGTFIIDDFGRQFVKPADLLNRWIVPLESRVDFMKLHTGKTFTIPFDELVIFSTNLAPGDLMDPAFLRRIPYKLKTRGPNDKDFRKIFDMVSKNANLSPNDDVFDMVVEELRERRGVELACYQPKFIADQVVSACKYRGDAPKYSRELVANALANLYVAREEDEEQAGLAGAA